MVLEELEHGVELLEERLQLGEHRPDAVERLRRRGQAGPRRRDERVEVRERPAQVGRQRVHVAQRRDRVLERGRRSWTSGSVAFENVSRRANVSFDSSRNVGKIWNVSASACWRARCRVERLPGRDDEVVELALVLGQRAEHDAGVADERLRLLLLAVEDPQQVGAVVGERGQRCRARR